jgi:hypothetical protein
MRSGSTSKVRKGDIMRHIHLTLGWLLIGLLLIGCAAKQKAPVERKEKVLKQLAPDLIERSVNAFVTGASLGKTIGHLDLILNVAYGADMNEVTTIHDELLAAFDRSVEQLESSALIFDSMTTRYRYKNETYQKNVRKIAEKIKHIRSELSENLRDPEYVGLVKQLMLDEVVNDTKSQFAMVNRSALYCFRLGMESGSMLSYLTWRQFHLMVNNDAFWNEKASRWAKFADELHMRTYEEIAIDIQAPVENVKAIFLRRQFTTAEQAQLGRDIIALVKQFYAWTESSP